MTCHRCLTSIRLHRRALQYMVMPTTSYRVANLCNSLMHLRNLESMPQPFSFPVSVMQDTCRVSNRWSLSEDWTRFRDSFITRYARDL